MKKRFLQDWDSRYVWHPFTQMREYAQHENIIIERGEGNYLIDTDGKYYFDGVSSLWVNLHGHGRKEIDKALSEQLKKISHSTLLGMGNVPSIQLAKKLIEITPEGLEHVFYSDNGSTAVEVAIKIAFEFWQLSGHKKKRKFVSFRDAYHGDTLGAVSVGQIEVFHEIYKPLLFSTFQAPSPADPDCLQWLDDFLAEKADSIAGVMIEPLVQAAGGMIVQPEGFLRKLRQLCTDHNVLLILDEVATGFGRTGTLFACEQEEVHPDILCLAKGLTGGYLPLAATLVTHEIYGAFLGEYIEYKTFFHGHSYTGNQLGCAAALANLGIFKTDKVLEKLPEKITRLNKWLDCIREMDIVEEVRQKGLMVGITLKPFPPEDRIGMKICREALKNRLWIRPLGDILVLMPPLSVTSDEIQLMVAVLREAIREVTGINNSQNALR